MNQTERRYAQRLSIFMMQKVIKNWRYESLKFRLAAKTFYTPDFCVIMPDGIIQLHEVKGPYVRDDARVKFKVAAEQFPEFVWIWAQWKGKDKGWKVEAYEGRSK